MYEVKLTGYTRDITDERWGTWKTYYSRKMLGKVRILTNSLVKGNSTFAKQHLNDHVLGKAIPNGAIIEAKNEEDLKCESST